MEIAKEVKYAHRLKALVVALVLTMPGVAQSPPLKVTYAELVKDPQAYEGKQVRIEAIWTYGFEWTYLCAKDCRNLEKAWVDLEDEDKLCKGTKRKLRGLGKNFDNTALVTVVGRLYWGGGFGHLGAYPLQFTISCVERFEKLH